MKYQIYLSYLFLLIGLILAGFWIAQEVSDLKVLDNPAPGAGIFFLLGFALYILNRNRTN